MAGRGKERIFWCRFSQGLYYIPAPDGTEKKIQFRNHHYYTTSDEEAQLLRSSPYFHRDFHEVKERIEVMGVSQVDITSTGMVVNQSVIEEARRRADDIARSSYDSSTKNALMEAIDADLTYTTMQLKAKELDVDNIKKRPPHFVRTQQQAMLKVIKEHEEARNKKRRDKVVVNASV